MIDPSQLIQRLRFRGTLLGPVELGGSWAIEADGFGDAVVYLVVEGQLFLRWPGGGDVVQLQRGDMAFLPLGKRHIVSDALEMPDLTPVDDLLRNRSPRLYSPLRSGPPGTGLRMLSSISIWEDASQPLAQATLPSLMVLRQADRPAALSRIIAVIEAEMQEPATASPAVVNLLVNALVLAFLRHLLPARSAHDGDAAADPALLRALGALYTADESLPTVPDLARRAGVSAAALNARFKAHLGTTVSRQRNRLRLKRAAALLLDHPMSVADVAREVGFASVPSFCKAFTRENGAPPGAWRRAQLERSGQPGSEAQPGLVSMVAISPSRKP